MVSVSAGMRSQLPHAVFALAGSQATHRHEMHGKRRIVQRHYHHNHRTHKTQTVKQCVTHPRVPVLLGRRQQHLIERLFFCWYIILSAGFPRSTLHDDSAKTPCLHRSSLTHTHTHIMHVHLTMIPRVTHPDRIRRRRRRGRTLTSLASRQLSLVYACMMSVCLLRKRVPVSWPVLRPCSLHKVSTPIQISPHAHQCYY